MYSYLIPILLLAGMLPAFGAATTYTFTGTTSSTMTVNNGTSTGSIPAGTAYSGTLTFDDGQTATPAAFGGGTKSTYAFTSMTLTMAGSTVSWGPGKIDVYDNLTSTSSGYPIGDSIYCNINGVAPSGTINGAQFNWIFLALLDSTGTAVTGGALPGLLSLSNFRSSAFIEFNYGTFGTPYGAGNTSTIQFLSTLVQTSGGGSPAPPTINTTSLPNGVVGVAYNAAVSVSGPTGDPLTVTVTGLPSGLSYAAGAISGIPLAVVTSSVTISVTDTVTNLTTTRTLPLTIDAPTISFNPVLPNGVTGTFYSASFAPATGGSGTFTYSASGLPSGLALSGTTVSGTTNLSGTFPVALTATDTLGASVTANISLTMTPPVPLTCSGRNGVISAYVARNPGYIVVNGGLNLLDHLWTTNLNSSNTTFQGGLINWYQTGLIVDWEGTVDTAGCILTRLTVRPAVTISTTFLPDGTAGVAYLAPVSVQWGAAPYTVTVSGLPAGLSFNGLDISGTPAVSGSFNVVISAVDSVGASTTKTLPLTIAANYTIPDEGKGKITAIGNGYLMAGTKKLIWNSATVIIVNTPKGTLNVIDSYVKTGMKVQWKGLRDASSNTVLTSKLEVN